MDVFLLALAGAVLPCLAWLAFFYTRDRNPEPKGLIGGLFLVGALPVVFVAGILNTIVLLLVSGGDPASLAPGAFLAFAVIVAPLTEEPLKYLGARLGSARSSAFDEPVDGVIYGTTVGLGFAAAETVDYLIQAYSGMTPFGTPIDGCEAGLDCFVLSAFLRGIGSAFLHASASGVAGYGLTRRVLEGRPRATALGWIGVAVLMHAAWNGVAFLALVLIIPIYVVVFNRALQRSPGKGPLIVGARFSQRYAWVEQGHGPFPPGTVPPAGGGPTEAPPTSPPRRPG